MQCKWKLLVSWSFEYYWRVKISDWKWINYQVTFWGFVVALLFSFFFLEVEVVVEVLHLGMQWNVIHLFLCHKHYSWLNWLCTPAKILFSLNFAAHAFHLNPMRVQKFSIYTQEDSQLFFGSFSKTRKFSIYVQLFSDPSQC